MNGVVLAAAPGKVVNRAPFFFLHQSGQVHRQGAVSSPRRQRAYFYTNFLEIHGLRYMEAPQIAHLMGNAVNRA